ncbi:hypothetical protein RB195_014868 [Necator americanus]|uniref:Uncharacterized protein n=1 Tax=Necator americanus TaxID=51031 RepID=A0ABR1E1Z1_NECAM
MVVLGVSCFAQVKEGFEVQFCVNDRRSETSPYIPKNVRLAGHMMCFNDYHWTSAVKDWIANVLQGHRHSIDQTTLRSAEIQRQSNMGNSLRSLSTRDMMLFEPQAPTTPSPKPHLDKSQV